MRKLATIETIKKISPIKNADAIEVAQVRSWPVVIKKGEFKEGDRVIYCEIDSLLPIRDEFEFLRKTSYISNPEGFRLKTVKLRGQISQGLILPVSILPCNIKLIEGLDVTEYLGITLYEPPQVVSSNDEIKGLFPWFILKTDLERVQNLNLQDFYDQTFEVTKKLDGTSFTCYKYESHFGVCSRNWELKEGNNIYWNIAKKYELDKKLPDGYALQGEIIGSGIQKNLYKLNNQQLYVFNVLTISDGKFLDYLSSQAMLKEIFEFSYLELVPLVSSAYNLNENGVESLLNFANISSLLNNKVIAEGLVFSSILNGEKVAFKVISNQFLLKY